MKSKLISLIGVLATSAALVLGTAGGALADPDNLPILHAESNQEAHQCVRLSADPGNSDGYYDAVVCSDIMTGYCDSGSIMAYGQVEVDCVLKSNDAIVPCSSVVVKFTFSSGSGVSPTEYAGCGSSAYPGPCDGYGQRNYFASGSEFIYPLPDSNCATNLDSGSQVYNIVFPGTQVIFQDGTAFTLNGGNDGSGESSGHVFVCP
jgi:hypothetical protein